MKLLLVLGTDDSYKILARYLTPRGLELIWYQTVIKAMDNIGEVDPQAIIISARDFPRHWKVMVQFLRGERAKSSCPIIILSGDNFSPQERSEAVYLGVSGVIPETLDKAADRERLCGILGCTAPVKRPAVQAAAPGRAAEPRTPAATVKRPFAQTAAQGRAAEPRTPAAAVKRPATQTSAPRRAADLRAPAPARAVVRPAARANNAAGAPRPRRAVDTRRGFVLARPRDLVLITGEISVLTRRGLKFKPHHPELLKNYPLNTRFTECSLRAGAAFLNPICRLVRQGAVITLEFLAFRKGEHSLLESYLKSLPADT